MFSSSVERAPARFVPEGVILPHWLTPATAVAVRTAMARCLAGGHGQDTAAAEATALVLAQHPALPLPLIRAVVEDLLRAALAPLAPKGGTTDAV
jgi:hypothetical protein